MDVRGWRKWLPTPAPIASPQKQEAGMLKLLLGHWKAHRKKPHLLPEDGDVHFEEPSTINPLFEDSDSSTSSPKRPSDLTSDEQNQRSSQRHNEQNENANDTSVVNELVDVSIPTTENDTIETVLKDIDTVIKEAESSNEETVPKTPFTDTEKDGIVLAAEAVSKPENLKKDDPEKDLKSREVNLAPVDSSPQEKTTKDILSKDEITATEIEGENMRISDQPSTSAIKQNKPFAHKTVDKNDAPQNPTLKPTVVQNTNNQGNTQKKINKSDSSNTKPSSTTQKFNKENSMPSNPTQTNKQSEIIDKPAKLRARAIDELIKKFQGPTAEENEKVVDKVAKPDKKKLFDPPAETSNTVNDVSKIEKKNIPSPSTENIGGIQKIPEKKDSPKVIEPTVQSKASNKNEVKKEALSNIFKFPPPPPLEQLKNESSLHGKLAKEHKSSNVLSSSSKMKDNADSPKDTDAGKTRSDSSLERTRTISSSKLTAVAERNTENETSIKIKDPSFKETFERMPTDNKIPRVEDLKFERNNDKEPRTETETSSTKPLKETRSFVHKAENIVRKKSETKLRESQPQISKNNFTAKKESPVPNPKLESNSSNLQKNSVNSDPPKVSKSPVQKKKSSFSKAPSKAFLANENENVISHSEDSGITRGDQISSETTQEAPGENPSEETTTAPNPPKKSRKEKKIKPVSKKTCKHCRRTHDDSISLKRGQCDEYYDGLTGTRHLHRNRHSDSWNSDLSWEEKELLRRLRSKRGTVRSNTPSTRSRHSRHRFINEDHFRRHHNHRRSLSDESTFYGSSLCSCDECWAMYVKDYAYGRASLRGMSPVHEMCTCRTSRQNFMGRRVQFRSDTIHEASPSERTTRTTTPAPPAEKTQEDDETDDKSSQVSQGSSKTKDDDSVSKHPDGIKDKKKKVPEENYRFVTPWELEEWDLLMRKQLLQRRRRRARCMGIMALAMVVFVGLVVAILMVYLRRKVI